MSLTMKFCINQATTMETDFDTDVRAYAAAGFEGVELWLDKAETMLPRRSPRDLAKLVADHGLTVAGACFQGDLMGTDDAKVRSAQSKLQSKLELCTAVGAPVLIVPTDFPETLEPNAYEIAAECLRQAADLAQGFGVKLAVEFIRRSKLVSSLDTANRLVKQVGRDEVGILFDIFHFWTGSSKESDIETIPEAKLFFVHVNDCPDRPREHLVDADRTYTGYGVVPVRHIVDRLRATGYDGWLSLEIFNRQIWKHDPFEVARIAHKTMSEVLA